MKEQEGRWRWALRRSCSTARPQPLTWPSSTSWILGSTKCTRYSTDQFPLLAEPSPDAFVIGTLHRHVCTHLVTYSAHTFFLEKGTPLYSPGWPGTSYIPLAGLKVRDQLASTFQVLGLKKCSTMPNSP